MDEEWLGTIYCLITCLGICFITTLTWHMVDKVGKIMHDFRDRKNKWK